MVRQVQNNTPDTTHFSLGSITENPITVSRGIEPGVCTRDNEAQNCDAGQEVSTLFIPWEQTFLKSPLSSFITGVNAPFRT